MMDEIYSNNQFLRVATNGCGDDFGYKLEYNKTLSTDIYMWDHEVMVSDNGNASRSSSSRRRELCGDK